MLDNALNNDTFVDGIERRAKKAGVSFNVSWARLHCMPHTIHLTAIKLLEGIGAVSSAEGKKAASCAGNYQDAATASLNCDFDNHAATHDDIEAEQARPGQFGSILLSVEKVLPYYPHHTRHGLTFMLTCSFEKLSVLSDQALRESSDGWI